MIKKAKTALLTLIITSSALYSQEQVRHYSTENIEQFQFSRGLKEGLEKGYKQGYRDALEFSKRQLRLYRKQIEAMEAGKYLKEYDRKITNPAIYQVREGNTVKVLVRGCKIARPLTPDEIIELPMYPVDAQGSSKFKYYNMDETGNSNIFDKTTFTNSSDIVARDGNGFYSTRPQDPYANNATYLYISNTQANRKKLELLNRDYTIEDGRIKITFNTQEDKSHFINRFKR